MNDGTILHSEFDITAGALEANDAYDLRLFKRSNGDYEVIVYMKIQFFFETIGPNRWSSLQKKQFMMDWESEIKTVWGRRIIKVLSNGKNVFLNFDFEIQEGGWMLDHWEITVQKINPGSFSVSYVDIGLGNVVLDSEDLTPVDKGASSPQRGAIHEFGHMLGLEDEYKKQSPHSKEKLSIMHSSETVRPRHYSAIVSWLEDKLSIEGIR